MAGRQELPQIAAAIWIFGVGVAFAPWFHHPAWALRVIVLLPGAAIGLVLLVRRAIGRDPAALAAAAFLALAAVSAGLAADGSAAWWGYPPYLIGLPAILALAGAWAVGREVSGGDTRPFEFALVAVAVVQAVAGVLQQLDAPVPWLPTVLNRSNAFLTNPVHLGAVAAAGAALLSAMAARDGLRWHRLVGIGVLGAGVQVSGTRSGLLAALASLVVLGVVGRPLRAVAAACAFLAGAALSTQIALTSAASATARLGTSTAAGPLGARVETWLLGLEALAERPVLGWGPGRFIAAESPRRTAAVAAEDLGLFVDSHNWVVEYAVTTGALGLLALGAWLVLAVWRGRGPLLLFALAVAIAGLAEPLDVGVAPLALFGIGAAWRQGNAAPRLPRPWIGAAALAASLALVAAGILYAGEVALRRAVVTNSVEDALAARRLLPPWAETSSVVAGAYGSRPEALRYAREVTRREPAASYSWVLLGDIAWAAGRAGEAERAYVRGVETDPQAIRALGRLAALAELAGEGDRRDELCRRVRAVRPRIVCPMPPPEPPPSPAGGPEPGG